MEEPPLYGQNYYKFDKMRTNFMVYSEEKQKIICQAEMWFMVKQYNIFSGKEIELVQNRLSKLLDRDVSEIAGKV